MLWGSHKLKEWFDQLKDGRTSVDSDQSSGRLSTSRNPRVLVYNLIRKDHRLTVREVADDVEINDGSAHAVLMDDLGMRPKLFSREQQGLCLE